MLEAYRKHVEERAAQGVVPQPLNAEQTAGLVELLKNPPAGEEEFLLDLITNRVPPGVDEAAYVKAGFLSAIVKGEATSPLIDKQRAAELLGTMQGGYNIATLVELLDDAELANTAAEQLKHTLLMFDAFHDVAERAKKGNAAAKSVLQSWADGEWFKAKPEVPEKLTLTVFKVPGETNTDDLSPAPDAWSRPDIPLHALAMLKMARDGIEPVQPGSVGPLKQIEAVKAKGFPVAYVGDVVGTGSSRKSATNSVLWFFGDDIPFVPNKRAGGFCFGTKIAPIFYNTMEDAGALPIEFDCTNLAMGDVIDVYPYEGKVVRHDSGEVVTTFELKTPVLLDEVRAGGRIPLIVGRGLTEKARAELGLGASDLFRNHTLPDFIMTRGGVSLRPGDGIIHSWLNRMLLPDTVGTGGDSHTRFPIGISFPAGSGLVAFAAATGVMPLDMPESVLVRFKGKLQPGITLRDLVHAIPYYAIQQGLLTVEKKGKKNIFSGRILEIEGLNDLTVEQAFELSDASAERSAAGCTIKLPEQAIAEYLKSNITLLRWMIGEGYGDPRTLERRAQAMEAWLAKPELLEADKDAEYAAVIEIDLADVKEPVLCAPNDPDDARLLSSVQGRKIDEVFIGSCMTNIGHFRAAGKLLDKVKGGIPTRLWLAPPTKMDAHQLTEEGYYGIYGKAGARMEMPGCSLCMGNQARVQTGSTVVSTSTRNFPNRLGDATDVFLASAELAAVSSILGKLPTVEEYMAYAKDIDSMAADVYRYLSFDQIAEFREAAANAKIPVVQA
nr:bifunctional aconitate hydratase 2/2-methylisocitrate dehydratase [Pseudomonas aeruginosa]